MKNVLFETFIENLKLPKLEDSTRSELEGEITLKEFKDVLCTFSSGKSPGDDGLMEFYNCFLIYCVKILSIVLTLLLEKVKCHSPKGEA